MKFSKKNLYILIFAPIVLVVLTYILFLFAVPKVLNSGYMVQKYENFLTEKLGLPVKLEGFYYTSKPDISFNAGAKDLKIENNNSLLFEIKNPSYTSKSFSLKPKSVNVDYIFADYDGLKTFLKKNNNTTNQSFDFKSLPIINIKNAFVKMDNKNSSLTFENIKSAKINNNIEYSFLGKLKLPYTKSPIIIGKNGKIIHSNNLKFDNLSVSLDNSKLFILGSIDDFKLIGKDLPADELKQSFLYFYKMKHHGKKNFLENFHNLTGKIDVDLNFKLGNVTGICYAKDMKALFFDYKIPIHLPYTEFRFAGKKITAHSHGTFGPEPVSTAFRLTGLGTKDVRSKGIVSSNLTSNFSKKYFPPVKIVGTTKAVVRYDVHRGNVIIKYYLDVPKGNNLVSNYGNLDNIDKNRRLYAQTLKQGNIIRLQKYTYSFFTDKAEKLLLYGDGLFEKTQGHFKPAKLTLKTNGEIPLSLVQSFLKNYITGGTFSSDVIYEFKKNALSGFVDIFNTSHKDYLFLNKINITTDGEKVKINSDGTFFNSPITLNFRADNTFKENILIHDISIHLDKYLVTRGNFTHSQKPQHIIQGSKSKDIIDKIIVKKGKIVVDEIYHKRFQIFNAGIYGKMQNNVVDFVIPGTNYANGLLSAKGQYNVRKHSSDIHFYASDIDSNYVATNMFNLKNQLEGDAYATLHLITKNKLNDIKAEASFAIEEGFLPKLGSKEFMLKNKKSKFKFMRNIKFTLDKITNIDFTNHAALASDINGSFKLDNDIVKDIKLFSRSDYLSMFVEGNYNIDSGWACLCVWGRHNKTAERKIKIFKIPLSFLYKIFFRVEHTKDLYLDEISKIPPIKIGKAEIESLFRVFVEGDLSSGENLKVIMKDLR